jgi:hypothetical protein
VRRVHIYMIVLRSPAQGGWPFCSRWDFT